MKEPLSLHVELNFECCVDRSSLMHLSFQCFAYDYCFWSMDEAEPGKFAGVLLLKINAFALTNPSVEHHN